jgi:predicted metalloprotease with PDZ domain
LDNSTSRERVYWGGNLFWLLADVQIRVRTGNRRSVDDAIRAILKAGGNGGASWSIERVIRVGDKATGTTVLKDLYSELGRQRGDIHLDSLWQALGVVYRHGGVRFDDSAPWAAFRASITARR